MDKLKYLKDGLKQNHACKNGRIDLRKVKTESGMIDLFYKNIDFCLAKDFPDLSFIKSVAGIEKRGIFVSKKDFKKNLEKLVLLGRCDFEASYSDYAAGRVYVKSDSRLTVRASGNSFVVIDALDNAKISVEASEDAQVVVNLYAAATCSGNARIIVKGKETYELENLSS